MDKFNGEIQTGDILCFKGKGFFSWIIRFLTWLQTGDRFQFSHIAIAYSNSLIASAEIKGFIMIPLEKVFRRIFKVVIYRYKNITIETQENIRESIENRLNTNYDLFMYPLHITRINLYFMIGELILAAFGGWKVFLIVVFVLIVIYWPIRKYLMQRESKTYGCSEITTEILLENKMMRGIVDPTNISPQVVYYILNNGNFDIVYDGDGVDIYKGVEKW